MAKWIVFAQELVYQSMIVEADSEEEAIKLAEDNNGDWTIDDGEDFQIGYAEPYEGE